MDKIYPSKCIYIARSRIAGLGVFSRKKILEGEIIEESPVIVIPEGQISDLAKTDLLNYAFFAWGPDKMAAAIVLGHGSLFNHSYEPNARYVIVAEENLIRFVAIKDIEPDEEIVMNYNGKPEDKTKLWFEAREERC